MSDIKLGSIIEGKAVRDAIHIAVAPVVAARRLFPGLDIGLDADGNASPHVANLIGIVDPFLKQPVEAGQRFYLVLYQNTVTGMRHHWSHPSFDGETASPAPAAKPTKAESEKWLRDFCDTNDCPSYELVLKAAVGHPLDRDADEISYANDGDYLTFYGTDAHAKIPPEFWDHVETVTGVRIAQGQRASSFSCSC